MHSLPVPEILPLLLVTEKINTPFLANPEVIFPEGNARKDNTEFPQGPSIFASRPIIRLKAKQAPRQEVGSVVHEEGC